MPPPANTTLLALLCACAALAHVPAHAQVPRVLGAPGPPALGRDHDAQHANALSQRRPKRIVRRRQHGEVANSGAGGAGGDGRAHTAAPAAIGGDLPLRARGLNPRRRARSTTGTNFVCDQGCAPDVTTKVKTECDESCDSGCDLIVASCDKHCHEGCDGTIPKTTPGVCNAGCKCSAGYTPKFSATSPRTPKQCAKCPANRFLAQCAKCPPGWYSPDTATWFQPCVRKTIGTKCADAWKQYTGQGSNAVTTRNDRCKEFGGTCTNGYLKDTKLRRKENECGKCFAGFKLAGAKCAVDPATAGWARPGECKDCATTTLKTGTLTYLHQSAGSCVYTKAGKPRLCQTAGKDTANKMFKCAASYTMCDPPLTTTPKKTCGQQYPEGMCKDIRTYTCVGGFAAGLCPGASTNACCTSGKYAPMTVPTPKPQPPPTPKPSATPTKPSPRSTPPPPPPTPPMLATTPPPAPGAGGPVCGVDNARNVSSFRTRQGMEGAGWKFSSTVAYMFCTDKHKPPRYSPCCWEPRTSYCGFVPNLPVGWIELKLSLREHASGVATIVFGNGARSAAH